MLEENRKSSHPSLLSLWIYVKDVDVTYDKALKAGCKSIQTPTHKYEVDKVAKILDPFGITWLVEHLIPIFKKSCDYRLLELRSTPIV